MATGYPMDIPPPGADLFSYLFLVWRLPLNIPFSLHETNPFVWGGCMLLRLEHLLDDK